MPGIQKIFIDAGHGGNGPGASGNGLKEKDVVLNIAQKLTGLFNSKGIQISHSRYLDNSVGLAERAVIANKCWQIFSYQFMLTLLMEVVVHMEQNVILI